MWRSVSNLCHEPGLSDAVGVYAVSVWWIIFWCLITATLSPCAVYCRDLHWGNVLVKTTKQKKGSFLLNGAAHSLETKGVLVRIIDYSLSRLEIGQLFCFSSPHKIRAPNSKDKHVLFSLDDLTVSCDISKDEELFMGQGDYQFDIYRLMRQENGSVQKHPMCPVTVSACCLYPLIHPP